VLFVIIDSSETKGTPFSEITSRLLRSEMNQTLDMIFRWGQVRTQQPVDPTIFEVQSRPSASLRNSSRLDCWKLKRIEYTVAAERKWTWWLIPGETN